MWKIYTIKAKPNHSSYIVQKLWKIKKGNWDGQRKNFTAVHNKYKNTIIFLKISYNAEDVTWLKVSVTHLVRLGRVELSTVPRRDMTVIKPIASTSLLSSSHWF